jgi:hypothetical protein
LPRRTGRARSSSWAIAVAAAALWPASASAGPGSVVTSALDPDDSFDVTATLDYDFVLRRAAIGREQIDPSLDNNDRLPVVDDLVYASSRHVLTPRLELGIFRDVWLSAALPIVVTDARDVSFDQRNAPCTFGAGGSCVDRQTSTTLRDGILGPTGFDARQPSAGFTDPNGDLIFRGPDRHGVDQVHLGLGVAPMNQARDATKPTWKLGAEFRVAIGAPGRLDRNAPDSEVGVGAGVHELRLWTTVAKRRGWAEPSVEIWWQAPIATKDDSPFDNPGYGARATGKQQEAGIQFGLEAAVVDRPADGQRVSVDLSGRVVGHFEGRAYSELWEVFAYAGDVGGGGPLILDSDPTTAGMQAVSHPGISAVENYLEMGARLALRAELGPWVHIAAIGQLTGESQHTISFADAGVDRPTCSGGDTSGCEADSNDVVSPGTSEVSPTHVPLIDLVGHRYIVRDAFTLTLGVEARVLF